MATPSVNRMRHIISEVYDNPTWKERVRLMADNQVIAVYYSFLEKGKFDKPTNSSKNETREQARVPEASMYFVPDIGEQLSFEF